MKILFRKLKRTNKVALCVFIVTLLAYITGYILFSKSLLSLSGIETLLRIIVIILFGGWLIGYLLTGLVKLIKRRYKAFIIMTVFSILFSFVFYFGSYYIDFFYEKTIV